MKLQIHAVGFDADEKLIDLINKRMDKLEVLYHRMIEGEIFLRLGNEKVKTKIVEVKLHVPGNHVFAKEKAENFEIALDLTVEGLRRQLRKLKGKSKN